MIFSDVAATVGNTPLVELARFSLNVAPTALQLTAQEYKALAEEIISKVRDAGVTITEQDIGKIVQEVQEHSDAIKQAYRMLKEVFGRENGSNETGER